MLGPDLVGERIRLTQPTVEMLPAFCAWLADLEVTRYLGTNHFCPPGPDQEKEWFDKVTRSQTDILWAVLVDDRLIGTTGIHSIDWSNRNATTGNLIGAKEMWGKGFGSETIAVRTRYAFELLGLEKLKTLVLADNLASRRALEKSGYRQCGLQRREEWRFGAWHDVWLGEVLRDEWLAAQPDAATT